MEVAVIYIVSGINFQLHGSSAKFTEKLENNVDLSGLRIHLNL